MHRDPARPDVAESATPTPERLARALEQALCPAAMVARARAGDYDDFLSDRDQPIAGLVRDLRALALAQPTQEAGQPFLRLAERAIAGDFDATREEGDAWAATPDGQAAMRGLLSGLRRMGRDR